MISIIIPVYNEQKWLPAALNSILAQTYTNLEVIVVDDGSDLPVNIPYLLPGSKPPLIKLLRQENAGAGAARNSGFAESKGDYVIFWDADVIARPDMLEKMYVALTNNKKASYAYCNFYFGWKKMRARLFDEKELRKSNYVSNMSLIRREHFCGYDDSLKRFQDWDLWLSMLENGKSGVWIDDFLFKARTSSKGISSWLPAFAYRSPFKHLPIIRKKVMAYNKACQVIKIKHHLL